MTDHEPSLSKNALKFMDEVGDGSARLKEGYGSVKCGCGENSRWILIMAEPAGTNPDVERFTNPPIIAVVCENCSTTFDLRDAKAGLN